MQFVKTKTGMINYIKRKEVFGKKRQRTYGKSLYLVKPTL